MELFINCLLCLHACDPCSELLLSPLLGTHTKEDRSCEHNSHQHIVHSPIGKHARQRPKL